MILHFNALIDNKPVFDQSLKNKQEAHEKLVKMSRNNDHTTGKNQKYYKLICIDLSRQTKTRIRKDDDGAATFFVAENQQKTTLLLTLRARIFSLESLIVTE